MKLLSTMFLLAILTFTTISTSASSDWEALPYNINHVLDQTEINDELYLISINQVYQDPVTYTTLGASYSIHRFDGTTMTHIVTFNCQSNNYLFDMNIESFQGKLYIAGGFCGLNGDSSMNYITCFDNGAFHQVGGGMEEVVNGCINDLKIYQNNLLVAGRYRLVNFNYTAYFCDFLTSYDGSSWSKFGSYEFTYWCYVTCLISDITLIDDDIIVVGEFDHIGSQPINSVARYHDGAWYSMTSPLNYYWTPGVVMNQDSLYTIRSQYPDDLSSGTLCFLDKWDGTSWQTINQISTGVLICSLVSFDNQLFISGGFSYNYPSLKDVCTLNTTTGDLISSFDLESFYPKNLFVYKSDLYATAAYSYTGASSLAKYHKEVSTTEVSSKKEVESSSLVTYPNPSTGTLFLKGDLKGIGAIQVLDMAGKVKLDFPEGYSEKLIIEDLSAGSYILKIEKEGNYLYQNFIKN